MPAPIHSFIEVAPDSHFPIQNLPYGIFLPEGEAPRVGVAIGDLILDLALLEEHGHFHDVIAASAREKSATAAVGSPSTGVRKGRKQKRRQEAKSLFCSESLNRFMALGRPAWRGTREIIQHLLSADTATLRDDAELRRRVFHRQSDVTMCLPARIGDYTDFYSSYHHAHNVGTMLRGPENALMPNWKWLPVAYHGRASSIVVSGTDVRRPRGQTKAPDASAPVYGLSKSFDFELETAFFIGPANPLGEPIPIDRAAEHIFGLVLMNDWSARDLQTWEYQPLGPFLAKNFCTSISPWVVTLEALEPFRRELPAQDPSPLSYLKRAHDFTFDITLEARLQTVAMKEPHVITRTNFAHLYWSISQQLAHHAVNGCNLQTGDLLASGTISGPTEDSRGCMLELTWRGANPLQFPGGESRKWLEDGDTLSITGWSQGDSYRIGFGEVLGRIVSS